MDQTPADHYLEPILVALLIVLRSNATELYAKLSRGLASPNDVMDYLRRLPNCKKLFSDKHIGLVVEAYLLAMDEDKVRKNLVMKELELDQKNENSPEHIHACEVLRMIESIQNSSRRAWLSLSDVTRKIDLAAGIRE